MDLPSTVNLVLPPRQTVLVKKPCERCRDGVANGTYCPVCNALGYIEVRVAKE